LDYVIGLGANLGEREKAFREALALLHATPGCRVLRVSPFYESEPLGPPQPRYLNAAARVESAHSPEALLDALLVIEVKLGRVRRERWGPRTLDLDILWAEEPLRSARLTIPHPGLCERAFALTPLLDVAPELRPQYGPILAALGGALSAVANVRSSTNAKP
jgi:2-amino-4-hydroxy-6-hydroxymethyldihydropteridine diphosphokinase